MLFFGSWLKSPGIFLSQNVFFGFSHIHFRSKLKGDSSIATCIFLSNYIFERSKLIYHTKESSLHSYISFLSEHCTHSFNSIDIPLFNIHVVTVSKKNSPSLESNSALALVLKAWYLKSLVLSVTYKMMDKEDFKNWADKSLLIP